MTYYKSIYVTYFVSSECHDFNNILNWFPGTIWTHHSMEKIVLPTISSPVFQNTINIIYFSIRWNLSNLTKGCSCFVHYHLSLVLRQRLDDMFEPYTDIRLKLFSQRPHKGHGPLENFTHEVIILRENIAGDTTSTHYLIKENY